MLENPRSNGPGPRPTSSPGRLAQLFRMTPGFAVFAVVYCIAALIYALYSMGTESGLYDYVMKLEMEIAGIAEQTITGLVTFGLVLAPLFAIIRIAGNLAPSLVWAPGLPKPELMEHLNRPAQRVSWRTILVVTAIPILAGTVLCPVMYYSEQRDQNEKIYPIDLTAGGVDPATDAKFVKVTGLIARQYALSFKRTFNTVTKSHEVFAPLTGSDWTDADPVRYFVRAESYEDSQGKVEWPDEFRHSGAGQFSGKIGRSLPAYVETEFLSKGLKIGPLYSVIELKNLPDPHASVYSSWAAITAGICLLVAVFEFLMMAMVRFMVANKQKRANAC